MGFKRTSEGRVFFSGTGGASNDDPMSGGAPAKRSTLQESGTNTASSTNTNTQLQVLTLLKSLNDKLQLSQIERKTMRKELESYRAHINRLEQKATESERAHQGLKAKISQDSQSAHSAESKAAEALKELENARAMFLKLESKTERADRNLSSLLDQAEQHKDVSLTLSKKQADLERKYNEQQTQIARETTSYQELIERLSTTEQKQIAIESQFKNALAQQARIVDKMDKEIESRASFMRKIDHIEQTVLSTQDALTQNRIGALSDQGTGRHLPSYLAGDDAASADKLTKLRYKTAFLLRNPVAVKAPIIALSAVVLLLAGWGISALQRPDLSEFRLPATAPEISAQQATAPTAPQWQSSQDVSGFTNPAAVPTPREQTELWTDMDTDASTVAARLNAIESGNPDAQAEQPLAPDEAANAQAPAETPASATVEIKTPARTPAETTATAKPEAAVAPPKAAEAPTAPAAQITKPAAAVSAPKADSALPESVKEIEDMARQGIAEAQHDLAAIYVTGHAGVKQDYALAAYWFDKAAQGGVVNASYNLGVLYHQGLGVERNIESAMRWYAAAADRGHPEAQYNLGIAHIEGIGVEYDPIKASLHFESAAKNGVIEAAYNLGLIYENGLLGTPKPDEALMWYKTAADAGSPEAQSALNQLAASLNISAAEIDTIVETMREDLNLTDVAPQTTFQAAPQKIKQPVPSTEPLVVRGQKNLMRLGLYPGPADGRLGPLTSDAVRTYQSMHQLPENGRLTENLIAHMQGQ